MSERAKHVAGDLVCFAISGLLFMAFVWFVGVVIGY